ncbi:MAG: SdrD B-like domain-containing protein, partial [Propionibacteriaceae bacterium]
MTDWTQIKAIRFSYGSTQISPVSSLTPTCGTAAAGCFTYSWTMNVPTTDASGNAFTPGSAPYTWNKIAAQGSSYVSGTTTPLLATEAPWVKDVLNVPNPVSVGDYVWIDNNRNGLQDSGEPGLDNVTVTLKDASGAVVGTTTTANGGYYSFQNLVAGAAYSVTFTLPSGYSWTTQNASADTSNSATTDLKDSDVTSAGVISFTAPATGNNKITSVSAGTFADNPGLDAGVVQFNLTLDKQLISGDPTFPFSTVAYKLTPHNVGPSDALGGWSVTDVLPYGLQLSSMTGSTPDYVCPSGTLTCTNALPFPAGADMGYVMVSAIVMPGTVGSLLNLAYVAPAPTDVTETNPLGTPPTSPTDASTTPTDNDSSVPVHVVPYVSVGDYVWYDANRDGLQTAGEPFYPNMTVQLFAGTDTSVAPLQTTTTNSNGYYTFGGLDPSTQYTIKFVTAAGETFTTQNASGDTSNSATTDLTDSDANPADGTVTFTSPATGMNGASTSSTLIFADNPGIDAGIVKYNLTLTKTLTTAGPFAPGMTVSYTLTPHNDGPVAALAGWSVTDILPAGLTLVSMSSTDAQYTCSGATCTSNKPLAAASDAPAITVTATIDATFTGSAHNVAYVAPATTDAVETNPLVVPTTTTDTTTTGTDNDAQADLSVPKVSVGDFAWFDTNRDGLQTAGEPVYAGMTVQLFAGTDTSVAPLQTATTNAAGYYSFLNLLPSTQYTIKFVTAAGESFTTQNAGGVTSNSATADLTDSDANPATGTVTFTTTATGANKESTSATSALADNPGIDAGVVKYNLTLAKKLDTAGPFVPGMTVTYTLTPHNDGPVAALAGWSVTDILPTGLTLVSMSSTDAQYTCTGATCTSNKQLAPASDAPTITVTATLDATFTGSAHNVAYVAPAGTDGPETTPLVVPTTTTDTSTTPTDNDAQADLAVAKVSIGDFFWWDTNRNGQQDAGELPVTGATVELYLNGVLKGSTTTDTSGYYAFKDLLPSTAYVVKFINPDTQASFTSQFVGVTATDSNANPADGTATVTTPATGTNLTDPGKADDPTIDAGLVKYNLSLKKSLDTAGPFIPGTTKVTYTLTPHNDGPSASLPGWSVTDILPAGLTLVSMTSADAQYTCTGATCTSDKPLAPNSDAPTITVLASLDAGVTGTLNNVAYVAPATTDVTETNPLVIPTTTTDTSTTSTDNDAQAPLSVAKVSIGDYVWLDTNRDGLQTAGEPPVKDVTVTLTDAAGVIRTTTTDATGYYWFADLVPGAAYTLTFTAPSGYSWTTQNVSGVTDNNLTTDNKDSDVNPADGTISFTAPLTGTNGTGAPDKTDNPTLDGGLVKYNLTLDKALTTTGMIRTGNTVTFTLTPHNEGPSTALAGWSITDVLPAGLTAASITGSTADYSCTLATLTCTNAKEFAAAADMGFVTVTATVDATATSPLTNLAYVAPAPTDVKETNPLGTPPTTPTDASTTPTDNDSSVPVAMTPYVSVGDFVWFDTNRDGLQTAGEPVYAGMTVQLFAGTDTSVAPLQTATTNAAGYYSFLGLDPSTQYTVKFVTAAGESFTTLNAGGVTSNSATADLTDSDANPADGTVTFTTTATGLNKESTSATSALADNPGIDAGIVKYNLTLAKKLDTAGPFVPGMTVSYTLTPHNDGPVAALAGWSVTDILPAGLTLVSMSSTDAQYTCTGATCTSNKQLAPASDAPTITVTATIDATFTGSAHNVAYVSPAGTDGPETTPLVVPTTTTDTSTTGTDNDAQADLKVDKVSIGDFFWWDTNRNGQQDAGELPVTGATVELYLNGTKVGSTTTDTAGYYA